MDDIVQVPAYPANKFLSKDRDQQSLEFTYELAGAWRQHDSLLMYCKQGALMFVIIFLLGPLASQCGSSQ